MDAYCAEVRKLEKHFQGLEILHVLRDSNVAADILAKLGSDRAKVPPGVFVEELSVPSIKQPGEITPELLAPGTQVLVITPSWTRSSLITSKKINYQQIKRKPLGSFEEARIMSWWKTNSTNGLHHQEYYSNASQQIKAKRL
jgi:hypothetical protein